MKIQIGSTIKTLRIQKKISQRQLAEALGVTVQAISKWENATCYPDLEHLQPLADFFNVTIDSLFSAVQK